MVNVFNGMLIRSIYI